MRIGMSVCSGKTWHKTRQMYPVTRTPLNGAASNRRQPSAAAEEPISANPASAAAVSGEPGSVQTRL